MRLECKVLTASASARLTLGTALLLTMPPLLWSANSVIGRMIHDEVPPVTLNLLRWAGGAGAVAATGAPRAAPGQPAVDPLAAIWRFLGLLGVACYNTFQYLALQTSTPDQRDPGGVERAGVHAGHGHLVLRPAGAARQSIGAVMSIIGVMLVMCRGEWQLLTQVQFVEGDVFVLIATAAWAWYSWQISLPARDPPEIRGHWANFFDGPGGDGLGLVELVQRRRVDADRCPHPWSWPVVAALLYIGIGPAVLAYRCWGLGVQRVGPNIAGFFSNLTPVFAAVLSSLVLGEWPQWYHLVAFVLIVGGIVVSSKR
jgi:drug/metabolite transporter (DMT)-like permease